MGKNSSVYNKVYHHQQRKKLIEKLGEKCEVCGRKNDLVIHRIFSTYNTTDDRFKSQTTFDGNIGTINKFTPVSQEVLKARNRLLMMNPDNMILLCFKCYSILRKIHGKKKRIGRREVGMLIDSRR